MLPGVESGQRHGSVHPALGEDRHGIDIGRAKHLFECGECAGHSQAGRFGVQSFGFDIAERDFGNERMSLVEGDETLRELSSSDNRDFNGLHAKNVMPEMT